MFYGKSRGQRRKLKRLLKNIAEIEPYQDIDEINKRGFEHFHVPCSVWLDMPKTSSKIKTEFCNAWIRKTEEIFKAKPENLQFCKEKNLVSKRHLRMRIIPLFIIYGFMVK